jgi:transposase-like protein
MINVDKNSAYPHAMAALKKNDLVEQICKLRQVKYLYNIVEQDHRFIKQRPASGLGFVFFRTTDGTLNG